MSLPADYLAVLEHLGRAFLAYRRATSTDAVLVGGAATALSTAGAFMSADFDVVAAEDQAFAAAMKHAGFIAENGTGHLAGGFYHPNYSHYAVEQVTGPVFDGLADRRRMLRLVLKEDSEIIIPAVEDLIADRLGQHAIASPADRSRLDQAQALFKMADGIDRRYLVKRIVEEGGDPALIGL